MEQRPSRRSDQSPEDAQTRHVRSSRSRIVAGENATVPPHRLRQSRFKGNATAGQGAIVNISSVAGSLPQAGFAAYGTGKAALSWLTRALAQDFAPKVRVNGIGVGATVTTALENFMTPEMEKTMSARTPLARLGEAEDIAACALYLASPAASYVTGEICGVNGGLTYSQVEMPRAQW